MSLTTVAAQVTSTGITAPTFEEILTYLKGQAVQIYGTDVYLEPDSQDGQLLAIVAKAIYDANMTAVAVFNQFSPATAQGEGLSSVVKINNIARAPATRSQVNVVVTGQAGTTINDGVVSDASDTRWLLPSPTVIPPAGSILVTALAESLGALTAAPSTVTRIVTPSLGWQSVTNPTAAIPGQAEETDAALRQRQQVSPSLNAYGVNYALAAALRSLTGVVYGAVYENDGNTTDANGLPPHSIACVVQGGAAQAIAETIYKKKSPGVATHGTTSIEVVDVSGQPRTVKFSAPTEVRLEIVITLDAGADYTTLVAEQIREAIHEHVAGLDIGEAVVVSRLYAPALLYGDEASRTYKINAVTVALEGDPQGTSDIPIGYSSKAVCPVANVTITVV